MVGFIEAFLKAFDSYKKHSLESIAFGIAYFLLGIISVIPILGAFIGAYLIPRLLSWFYNKIFGNISVDHKISFRVWLFYLLLTNLIAFQLLVSSYLFVTSVVGIGSSISINSVGLNISPYDFYVTKSYSFISGLLLVLFTFLIVIVQSLVLQIFLVYTL